MEEFVIDKYGENKGKELWRLTSDKVTKLMNKTKLATSKDRKDTLKNVIFSKPALYLVLHEKGLSKEEAYDVVYEFLHTVVCVKSKKQYQTMEKIPCFFTIFKKVFIKKTTTSDLWTSSLKCSGKDSFEVDITRCLWHDACSEAGCPEICKLFCGNDDENFGELRKIKFIRKGTLGRGDKMCDFMFEKRK